MDYTTTLNVIQALHIKGVNDTSLLDRLVTAASRMTDTVVCGTPKAENYFQLETVENQRLYGLVDVEGNILAWPKKAPINSVSAFSWRYNPTASFTPLNFVSNPDIVEVIGPNAVKAWTSLVGRPTRVQIQMSYSGGFAAAPADLPADLVELATLMAGRIYREDEGGLQDAIGIATIGSIQFTKAVPERYDYLVQKYSRVGAYDFYGY